MASLVAEYPPALMLTVTADATAVAYPELRVGPKYAAGNRGRGRYLLSGKGGRRYAADLIRVDWFNRAGDSTPGFPGPCPCPVFRAGSEARIPNQSQLTRPAPGLTMPRRNGAHG
jgi:hypothetical protein